MDTATDPVARLVAAAEAVLVEWDGSECIVSRHDDAIMESLRAALVDVKESQ